MREAFVLYAIVTALVFVIAAALWSETYRRDEKRRAALVALGAPLWPLMALGCLWVLFDGLFRSAFGGDQA